ncbi:MAG TPA: zinc metallopeptidase [Saprospiraceae bacterium]|nr:zinc metallopeptidase [Saprospiraceae bacterium]MCB9270806.1 zinc metallopeptidase [Lewinellaceae bacterium]HPG05824.1 zinc metallopeptidase [Saprospiraceae bacterium]HPQ99507.1 zinc metallopeptidase [Saprospiraceae bacterium]HRV85789.1 zinc metallopeptidase [Saprospiraceae bacterium]
MYIIIIVIFGILSLVVSTRLKNKFKEYSHMPLSTGMSGAEVAQKMLRDYGINNVRVAEGQGTLTDHYNPKEKVVLLSPDVYHGRSVASAAVAAHECGHAVQDDTQYAWLKFRSSMVPVVQFASMAQQWLFMGLLFGFGATHNSSFLLILVVAMGITTAFSLITLPVEFDASNRALAWLDKENVTHSDTEYYGAKDALKWAALTYVVGALSALATLLYFVLRFMGSRD